MIYYDNLENLILDRHTRNHADEIIILSGWTGSSPIKKLSQLPIQSTVIHGIKSSISKELTKYQNITNSTNTDIWVKNKYNHSKIYCWLKNGSPIDILSGSANLSTSGLNKAFKGETLFDIDQRNYTDTHNYLLDALRDSVISTQYNPTFSGLQFPVTAANVQSPSTTSTSFMLDKVLSFVPPKVEIYVGGIDGTMQAASGWNWGHGKAHNSPNVAYQRLSTDLIKAIPWMFPNDGVNENIGSGQGLKNNKPQAEILFDDGFVMDARFEQKGGRNEDGEYLYKAITSYPDKANYGEYVRRRIGVPSNAFISDADIARWGKDTITLELLSPGVYYCDFSEGDDKDLKTQ